MNRLAQTEVFSHQSFVYVFSQSAPQYEGSFVVGLCVGKECDKDFKGLDKSTLSFGESPVICNIARGVGGGGCTVVSSPQKTHPVISSTPEQLFLQLRSWHTEEHRYSATSQGKCHKSSCEHSLIQTHTKFWDMLSHLLYKWTLNSWSKPGWSSYFLL